MLHYRLLLPAVAAVLLLSGCDRRSDAEVLVRPVLSVEVKTAQRQSARLAGTVQARVESELAFQTLGRVISRKVEVGDIVRKGDVLAEIDPLTLQLAVASAEAELRDAQARLENAALTAKRRRALSAANAMSIENLEMAEQALSSAQAAVAQARARLDKAREQLGYTRLTARFDGVITAVSVEIGQTVTAGQTAMRLARLQQRDVVVDMPESQVAGLRLGNRFDISLQIDDAVSVAGVLREITPQADASTRTRRLKIGIDDAPVQFRLGTVVAAALAEASASRSAMLLPVTAIRRQKEERYVWVIAPSTKTVSLRAVQIEAIPGEASHVRVLDGLSEGEEVAVAGVNVLTPGQMVRIERTPNL